MPERTPATTQICSEAPAIRSYQYRNGVFDEEEFAAERNTWKALGERTPQLRTVYCLLKQNHGLSPAFVAEMDKLAYGAPGGCNATFDQLRATQGAAQTGLEKEAPP